MASLACVTTRPMLSGILLSLKRATACAITRQSCECEEPASMEAQNGNDESSSGFGGTTTSSAISGLR